MADRVFTLAVWHIALEQWVAFFTSADRDRVSEIFVQADFVSCMYLQIVEVEGSTDDDIVAALAKLTPICRFSVLETLRGLHDGIVNREIAEQDQRGRFVVGSYGNKLH